MGCCQTATMVNRTDQVSPIRVDRVVKLEVTIFPKLAETGDKSSVCDTGSPGFKWSSESEPTTQMNTPKAEPTVVFVMVDKDIEYKVPKLLSPDSSSTIMNRRKKRAELSNFDDLVLA